MNVVFIHQNMPGQWRHIIAHLAAQKAHRIVVIGKRKRTAVAGVDHRTYQLGSKYEGFGGTAALSSFESFLAHGRAVASILQTLKAEGFRPDVIAAHPGWGESLFAKDVFPDVPLLHYCEFYYRSRGSDFGFASETSALQEMNLRARNAGLSLALEAMDWGVSPTQWQKDLHPSDAHRRISVIHEGIDTDTVCPNENAQLRLANGKTLSAADEVVTFVARNLEPHRGFDKFLFAAQILQKLRPNAHIVIEGGDGVSYGKSAPAGESWRTHLLQQVQLDPERTHFVGLQRFSEHIMLLQVSTVHAYLSIPFVLSWSMTEAMSAGCLVVGSDIGPVRELINHEQNGLLVDYFDADAIAFVMADALQRREEMRVLRANARATIVKGFDQQRLCVPRMASLLSALVRGEATIGTVAKMVGRDARTSWDAQYAPLPKPRSHIKHLFDSTPGRNP